jgi:hypothetical protein
MPYVGDQSMTKKSARGPIHLSGEEGVCIFDASRLQPQFFQFCVSDFKGRQQAIRSPVDQCSLGGSRFFSLMSASSNFKSFVMVSSFSGAPISLTYAVHAEPPDFPTFPM